MWLFVNITLMWVGTSRPSCMHPGSHPLANWKILYGLHAHILSCLRSCKELPHNVARNLTYWAHVITGPLRPCGWKPEPGWIWFSMWSVPSPLHREDSKEDDWTLKGQCDHASMIINVMGFIVVNHPIYVWSEPRQSIPSDWNQECHWEITVRYLLNVLVTASVKPASSKDANSASNLQVPDTWGCADKKSLSLEASGGDLSLR